MTFKIHSPFEPSGDQPAAIAQLTEGVLAGDRRDVHAARLRGGIDLVVHVGDVARVQHRRIQAAQQAHQHVAHRLPHIRDLLQRHELMFAPGPQALR